MPTTLNTPSEYFETYIYSPEPIYYQSTPMLYEDYNQTPLLSIENNEITVESSTIGGGNYDYVVESETESINYSEVITDLANNVSIICLTEPFNYLFGVIMVLAAVKIVKRIIT